MELFADADGKPEEVGFDYGDVSGKPEAVIIGAGPAGLFAALRLIEHGIRPVILERGKEVARRKKDIAVLNRNVRLDPDSNYAFGEGGAGTFSDGKLYTRSKKRGDYRRALNILVRHGASPEILYEAHPHIGTDRLPGVITRIRETIESCGGSVLFGARVTRIEIKEGKVVAVDYTASGNPAVTDRIDTRTVILATGHSASDIYQMIHDEGLQLEPKNFAMGVRIEHPQELIDRIQYHMPVRGEYLPAASYSLTEQIGGRGVYSFCMCPGGFIVPAMTGPGESVVNGMSPSGRNSPFANSGIVTEIREGDFSHLEEQYGVMAGLEFRKRLEQTACISGGAAFRAPAQRVADFVTGRASSDLPPASYVPGLTPSAVHAWLPEFISLALRKGIEAFGRRLKGFVTNEGVVAGVESRTSTPLRIPRDPVTLAHPQAEGLYPAGEGAGYAGGIISAAMDGERVADAIARRR